MGNVPIKRYGKKAERVAKNQAIADLAADGVSRGAIKSKPKKTDQAFLDSVVQTLHGIAIGLNSRDLAGVVGLSNFEEARLLSAEILMKLSRAAKRNVKHEKGCSEVGSNEKANCRDGNHEVHPTEAPVCGPSSPTCAQGEVG